MDIKETLLNLIQSDGSRYSFMAVEKLISIMLQDYASRQSKATLIDRHVALCDLVFPDGIDDIEEKVAVEIKFTRHKQIFLRAIYDTIGRFSINRGDINTLILIVANEVPEIAKVQIDEKKNALNFNLVIWDINKLVEIFKENEKLFFENLVFVEIADMP